ncbi:hypothetical protein B296_00053350 [Ensete ventricosum]|uniref:Uncharacterized protein n=1 Tax=Ensete ventricosum TaxID=4639 RepID=A0A426X7N7_ENSVE|nr:hypothetical protein B296_00053350 [Ensete ventricosum]
MEPERSGDEAPIGRLASPMEHFEPRATVPEASEPATRTVTGFTWNRLQYRITVNGSLLRRRWRRTSCGAEHEHEQSLFSADPIKLN